MCSVTDKRQLQLQRRFCVRETASVQSIGLRLSLDAPMYMDYYSFTDPELIADPRSGHTSRRRSGKVRQPNNDVVSTKPTDKVHIFCLFTTGSEVDRSDAGDSGRPNRRRYTCSCQCAHEHTAVTSLCLFVRYQCPAICRPVWSDPTHRVLCDRYSARVYCIEVRPHHATPDTVAPSESAGPHRV